MLIDMGLETIIMRDIKDAMLSKNALKLDVCRAIKSAILILKTQKSAVELSEDKEIEIFQKLLKQRKEAESIYKKQGRLDLAQNEKAQANIILTYTGNSIDKFDFSSNLEPDFWNREHVWPKSRGDFGDAEGPGTDVHALRPCDISVNASRSNRWFAECDIQHIDGDGPTGCYISATEWVWKPNDNVKGDVARMIFYMATRYEGQNSEPDLELIDYLPANNNTSEPIHAKLSDLLLWHEQDPVDDWERQRNDIIYYDFQSNRNPFIDHPEFAQVIWGDLTGSTTYSKTPKTLIKVMDFLGKEVDSKTNKLLIYLYSDGSVEKKFESSNK